MTDLTVDRDGAVLWLTIDREDKRNALTGDVLRGMLREFRGIGPDDDIGVVVVTSAGDGVFCSGADLGVMTNDATGLEQHQGRGLLRDVILAMRACPRPVVARVQGLTLAGGVGLVLGCDVALVSSAAQFGLPEVNLGLWPFMVSALLARHVSPKHAMHLMFSAERIDAQTAYRMGLVSAVYPAETFAADVEAYVARLAAAPPVAVRLGKAAWQTVEEATLAPALEAMQAQLSLLTTTRDAAEGVAAFFEKRPPDYTGR